MKFELFFPVFPIHYNQGFGANSSYYAKFLDSFGKPMKGHMGVDLQAIHGQKVYAAHNGMAQTLKDDHGGEGVYIHTSEPDDNGKYWNTIYWHLIGDTDSKYSMPFQGLKEIKRGDLIGYANNTGAPYESTGDHLHFGLAECDQAGNFLHRDNGYGGCQDPTPFFNGLYAADSVNPLPPSVNVALIATQNAQNGNITLANLLFSIVSVIRAWLSNG